MRHKHGYRKLGRETSHRVAMLRNLANSLVDHERITTTLPKAKELRKVVERLVTLGKEDSVHKRRLAAKVLYRSESVKKVFENLGPRMIERPGGYTRIIRRGERFGDGAQMAMIEFVDYSHTKD